MATPGDEVRVAGGTYKPTANTNRLKTFQLKNDVVIYGGFAGCGAADPDDRDFAAYETVLSGDLLDNDDPTPVSNCCVAHGAQTCDNAACAAVVCGQRPNCCSETWDEVCSAAARVLCCDVCGNHCENSYHVVTGSGADEDAVLDGFTVTAGYANGNNPSDRGAGIFSFFVASRPTIRNCIIRRNAATGKGAGMSNDLSGVNLINCLFTDNVAPSGAAIFNFRSAPVITNCTISENTAFVKQGGIRNATNDSPTISNSILWGNLDNNSGMEQSAQMNLGIGTVLLLNYSCVQGLTGLFGGTGNVGEDPRFVDPDGADDLPGTTDDNFRLMADSPLINAGDPTFLPQPEVTDLDLQTRVQGCRVDMGAYESAVSDEQCDEEEEVIPTVSRWGLVIMTLLLLVAGKIQFQFGQRVAA